VTRLHQALERAQTLKDSSVAAVAGHAALPATAEVPATWQFGPEEDVPHSPVATPATWQSGPEEAVPHSPVATPADPEIPAPFEPENWRITFFEGKIRLATDRPGDPRG